MNVVFIEAGRVPENDAGGAVDPGVTDRVHQTIQIVENVGTSGLIAIPTRRLLRKPAGKRR